MEFSNPLSFTQSMPQGYLKLSAFQGRFPEAAIFRRFAALNAQNILYMQAELSHLELELTQIIREDHQSGDLKRRAYDQDWWTLNQASKGSEPPAQPLKIREMRKKLQAYNAALLQQSELYKLDEPRKHQLAVLRRWLQSPEYGSFSFRGVEGQIWEENRVDDFVTMKAPQADQDPFSDWCTDWVVTPFHQYVGYRFKKPIPGDTSSGLTEYKDSTLAFAASIIVMFVAAMLPAVSIFALFLINSLVARLGMITVFSGLFSASLAIFTRARKIEVFAATAAFASIQAIFVGNNGCPVC